MLLQYSRTEVIYYRLNRHVKVKIKPLIHIDNPVFLKQIKQSLRGKQSLVMNLLN
jgi:hypothetical protein